MSVSHSASAHIDTGNTRPVSMTYDADGDVLTDSAGNTAVRTYTYDDPEDRLTGVTYTHGLGYTGTVNGTVGETYDGWGRLSTHSDGVVSKSFAYDDLDDVVSDTTSPVMFLNSRIQICNSNDRLGATNRARGDCAEESSEAYGLDNTPDCL